MGGEAEPAAASAVRVCQCMLRLRTRAAARSVYGCWTSTDWGSSSNDRPRPLPPPPSPATTPVRSITIPCTLETASGAPQPGGRLHLLLPLSPASPLPPQTEEHHQVDGLRHGAAASSSCSGCTQPGLFAASIPCSAPCTSGVPLTQRLPRGDHLHHCCQAAACRNTLHPTPYTLHRAPSKAVPYQPWLRRVGGADANELE